jgi:hypothetical protein
MLKVTGFVLVVVALASSRWKPDGAGIDLHDDLPFLAIAIVAILACGATMFVRRWGSSILAYTTCLLALLVDFWWYGGRGGGAPMLFVVGFALALVGITNTPVDDKHERAK